LAVVREELANRLVAAEEAARQASPGSDTSTRELPTV
jgi:hypothetical protein